MADEPTEIFDDLYLGLRAGGALRKKRRGEPLTMEEEEALGRWESLSTSAQGGDGRRLRDRDVLHRLHPRRPRVRPLAQSLRFHHPGTGADKSACAFAAEQSSIPVR